MILRLAAIKPCQVGMRLLCCNTMQTNWFGKTVPAECMILEMGLPDLNGAPK